MLGSQKVEKNNPILTWVRELHNGFKLRALRSVWVNHHLDQDDTAVLLDIGCGRANDQHKWPQLGITNVVGVDPDAEQLTRAIERTQVRKSALACSKQHEDANELRLGLAQTEPGRDDFVTLVNDTRRNSCGEQSRIAAVSIFFAAHYWFSSVEAVRTRLARIRSCIADGTPIVIITMVGMCDEPYRKFHMELLGHLVQHAGLVLDVPKRKGRGRKAVPIIPAPSVEDYVRQEPPNVLIFQVGLSSTTITPTGTQLVVHLEGAPYFDQHASVEYAVSLPLLRTLLKETGFTNIKMEPFIQPIQAGT